MQTGKREIPELQSLQKLCSFVIWKNVGVYRLKQLHELPLPRRMQQYVLQSHNLEELISRAVVIRQTEHAQFWKGDDPSGTKPIVYATVSMENQSYARLSSLLRQWDRLHHPGISRCYYLSENSPTKSFLFVLNNFPNTTLDEWLESHPNESSTIITIFLHVAEAVQYLHYRGIYNSRLTPGNVVVSPEGYATIVLVNLTESKYKWFSPPHHPHLEKRSEKHDVWRLGLILYQLLFKQPAANSEETLSGVSVSMIHRKVDSSIVCHQLPGYLARFLKQCLNVNPARRPTLSEVLSVTRSLQSTPEPVVKRHKRPASAPAVVQRTSISARTSVKRRPESATASRMHTPNHIDPAVCLCDQDRHQLPEDSGCKAKQELAKDAAVCKPRMSSSGLVGEKCIVWPNSSSFFRVSTLHFIPRLPTPTKQEQTPTKALSKKEHRHATFKHRSCTDYQ